ncbi:Adiponectin receptor protein, partial [Fragariocoptes setiger]
MATQDIVYQKKFLQIACKTKHAVDDFITGTVCPTTEFKQQPEWLCDNQYIHCGHRKPTNSFLVCTRSIFQLHNETVNIWTHLIAGFYFAHLCLQIIYSTQLAPIDKWVVGLFLLSATSCHIISSMYHTFNCHSEHVSKICSRMDYCGIISLILFSFVPWIHYGFYLYPKLKAFYLILVITLGFMAVNILMQDKFSRKSYRWLRVLTFISFGISGVLPGFHWLSLNYEQIVMESALRDSFFHLLLMGALYLTGTMLYAFRIPERYFPGKCDIFWHSHQLFHVFVSAATLVHFHGINELAGYIKTHLG